MQDIRLLAVNTALLHQAKVDAITSVTDAQFDLGSLLAKPRPQAAVADAQLELQPCPKEGYNLDGTLDVFAPNGRVPRSMWMDKKVFMLLLPEELIDLCKPLGIIQVNETTLTKDLLCARLMRYRFNLLLERERKDFDAELPEDKVTRFRCPRLTSLVNA
jgi:hypothetical protein